MRAMFIRSPHFENILAGKKTWEIRGSRTNVREQIGLIRIRSGKVIGVCELVDCVGPLTADEYRKNARKMGIKPSEAHKRPYGKTFKELRCFGIDFLLLLQQMNNLSSRASRLNE